MCNSVIVILQIHAIIISSIHGSWPTTRCSFILVDHDDHDEDEDDSNGGSGGGGGGGERHERDNEEEARLSHMSRRHRRRERHRRVRSVSMRATDDQLASETTSETTGRRKSSPEKRQRKPLSALIDRSFESIRRLRHTRGSVWTGQRTATARDCCLRFHSPRRVDKKRFSRWRCVIER